MSDVDSLSVVYLLMALALPVSALIGWKLEWRRAIVMALAWIGIFFVIVAIFGVFGA